MIKRLSYTALHLLACPWAFFLRYEAGLKEPVSDSLALGLAVHRALEDEHMQEEFILDRAIKNFLKEFHRIIEEDDVFIGFPRLKKLEAEGADMIELYHSQLGTKISRTPLVVEKSFSIDFEGKIEIVGKIDKIELADEEEEEYIVTDYKTGRMEPDEWFLRHNLQFTAYAWACLQDYGKLPKKCVWHHLRNGKQIETVRTMEDIEDLKQMVRNALKMDELGIKHRVLHEQVCNWCGFKGEKICTNRELERDLLNTYRET